MWHLQAIQELNSLAHACTLAGIPEKSALKVMVDPRHKKSKKFLLKVHVLSPQIKAVMEYDEVLASLAEQSEPWND